MPAAAPRPLLRSLPIVVTVLTLLLPAAPALAQPIVSMRITEVNDRSVSVEPWQGVELTEGSSFRLTFTAEPMPATGEVIQINGFVLISHDDKESTHNPNVQGSFPRFNTLKIELRTRQWDGDALYADNNTYEGNRSLIVQFSRRSGTYRVDEADSNTRSLTITVTDEEDAHDPDVNASGSVDANDALILYYAYALRNDLGTGR